MLNFLNAALTEMVFISINRQVSSFAFLFLFTALPGFSEIKAQDSGRIITGNVYEQSTGVKQPLIGANVYWAGTTTGTVTGPSGEFAIRQTRDSDLLVVSFTGYVSDTFDVRADNVSEIILTDALELEGVEVVKRRKTMEFSAISPIKVEKIGEEELLKAACCNLSESFETNPSVDVSFTDAITGTRQIQMLGLAGPYTQITRENMPDIRGLSAIFGMEYIPGTWIESIQLNKGTGSVVNGYESIAGQINVELRKPHAGERLYLNLYGNQESRIEGNLILNHKLTDKTATSIMLHGRNQSLGMDNNNDGFIDKPTGNQLVFLNRWETHNDKGRETQMGIKGTVNSSQGGQESMSSGHNENLWLMNMNTNRYEGWIKSGKVYLEKPYQSYGMQLSGISHEQAAVFGLKDYRGDQQSLYGNFIFQSAIGDTRYKYKTGLSFQADYFDEKLDSLSFSHSEIVPGSFLEFTWSPSAKFDIVTGFRGDYHSVYGLFFTPRLHLRYAPVETSIFRLSAGRGLRTASILAENITVLASARQVIVETADEKKPYGLNEEIAWNFGANFTQKFKLLYRDAVVSFDLYHTRFVDQVIVDLDQNPQEVRFYNLDGESYSTSFQLQADYELIRRLDLRLAYRWYDVQTTYKSGIRSKPLVSENRAFANLAYQTPKNWKFDYTVQWYGPKRIPFTGSNPQEYQLEEQSPSFFIMNAQVSKTWKERFEIYLGAENLLGYIQENPILASDDPFGSYFDSSLIWGPVSGRMIYAGIRLKMY